MAKIVPLPKSVRQWLKHNTHPGLLLDKYAESWDDAVPSGKRSELVQKPTVQKVDELSQQPPPDFDFEVLRRRWQQTLDALAGTQCLRCTTAGPMTLHLARASALENAGICLHPVYGFVYLPGTGLKGMAHAYACEVWLPAQPEKSSAWNKIGNVFGWAPSPWLRGLTDRLKVKAPPESQCGSIVFHDSWPESWPRLIVDILNNHHVNYYQDAEPPGDWDAPVPVYFLAVPAGQTFTFALAKRRSDVPDECMKLAREWLVGALLHEGAGAKTATGYGAFKLEADSAVIKETAENVTATWGTARQKQARAEFSYTVELVTPAFLAGADQERAEDCQLRPATLRGLLRWWWRTMYAAHVEAATLARLEAAVWGDTAAGGAVRITLQPVSGTVPLLYDKETLRQQNLLPKPPNNKTTQGLWYHTFGMDDKRKEGGQLLRRQRYFVVPGARWIIKLTARKSSYDERNRQGKVVRSIPLSDPQFVLQQAQAALWLLCHYGGIGSKSRKGFGCLAVPKELMEWNVERCKQIAAELRQHCQLQRGRPADSPALEQMLTIQDTVTPWSNYWFALDQVAAVAQEFAQRHKHNLEKKSLGLPRNVRPPVRGSFRPGSKVSKTDRHASPAIYHLAPGTNGLNVRVVAFPSPELPTLAKSQQFLQELLDHVGQELPKRIAAQQGTGRTMPVNPSPPAVKPTAPQSGQRAQPVPSPRPLIKPGDRIEVVLVVDPKAQDRPFARYDALGLVGPIVNAKDMPGDKKVGDKISLTLHSLSKDGKQIMFRVPKAADEPKGKNR